MDKARIEGLIRVWHGKAFREKDHFSPFLFLWICFNMWLEYKSEKDIDVQMIDWLVAQYPDTSNLVERFEKLKNNPGFRDALKALANNSPIADSRGIRHEIQIRDESDFENIVRAIYRIRCNLFHGGKSANESRDLRLVALSNVILNHWVGSLISGW